jgi:hypothetical protein
MAASLTQTEFSRHVNTTFHTELADGRVADLELVEVKAFRGNVPEETGMERFSAFFLTDESVRLQQQIYVLTHEEMGEIQIFLVPIANNGKGNRYEAVFNFYTSEAKI